ncbi:MAG TPA: homogentisate 1,2-dioxygenase, partial [Gemmatales bacterium]|nr:homogentisate 1,2-dioxygenase [Gemmatales bacterium]
VGFERAYSICYHLRPPTRVLKVEPAGILPLEIVEGVILRHHHLKSGHIPSRGDVITGRLPLLTNKDVTISRCRPAQAQSELFRNATADEVVFVHHGRGKLHTPLGIVSFKPFDYVVIPRCTTYQFEFDPGIASDLLIIESSDDLRLPARYYNPDGQLRLGAPYSERDFHGPAQLHTVDSEKEIPVLVKDGDRYTRYILASHPFDVVGWDGFLYPFTFNADDFEPITGTIHQPPPIHQTFETRSFVVCTFAPRFLDHHPDAVKVPYVHSNVGADEVLYYVRGNFGSRRGVEQSSFTLHPRGIPHGPHPGTIVASREISRTDELAVMVDTHLPLQLTRQALDLDDPQYPYSWLD